MEGTKPIIPFVLWSGILPYCDFEAFVNVADSCKQLRAMCKSGDYWQSIGLHSSFICKRVDFREQIHRVGHIRGKMLCLTESHELCDAEIEGALLSDVHDFACDANSIVVTRAVKEGLFQLQLFKWPPLEHPFAHSGLLKVEPTHLCFNPKSTGVVALLGEGQVVLWTFELDGLDRFPPLEDALLGLRFDCYDQLFAGLGALGKGVKVWDGESWSQRQEMVCDPFSTLSSRLNDGRIVSVVKEGFQVDQTVFAKLGPKHGVLHLQAVLGSKFLVVLKDSGEVALWFTKTGKSKILCKGDGNPYLASQLSIGRGVIAFVLRGSQLCLITPNKVAKRTRANL